MTTRLALFVVTLAALAAPLAAQRTVDPRGFMSRADSEYVRTHFDPVTLSGNVFTRDDGTAQIKFTSPDHPDGYELPPSCGLKGPVRGWIVTDSVAFTSFRADPGANIEFSCVGWMWKPGAKGKP